MAAPDPGLPHPPQIRRLPDSSLIPFFRNRTTTRAVSPDRRPAPRDHPPSGAVRPPSRAALPTPWRRSSPRDPRLPAPLPPPPRSATALRHRAPPPQRSPTALPHRAAPRHSPTALPHHSAPPPRCAAALPHRAAPPHLAIELRHRGSPSVGFPGDHRPSNPANPTLAAARSHPRHFRRSPPRACARHPPRRPLLAECRIPGRSPALEPRKSDTRRNAPGRPTRGEGSGDGGRATAALHGTGAGGTTSDGGDPRDQRDGTTSDGGDPRDRRGRDLKRRRGAVYPTTRRDPELRPDSNAGLRQGIADPRAADPGREVEAAQTTAEPRGVLGVLVHGHRDPRGLLLGVERPEPGRDADRELAAG